MIYFCADDYGISKQSNTRIENCIKNGVLNKVSVLPNGELGDFKENLSGAHKISLHLNLVEGYPLSNPKDVDLLVTKDGNFRHSFIGLFFLSYSGKRRRLEEQLYKEIKKQLVFWKEQIGETPVCVDSHQHTHMIPLVFKTLLRVIKDERIDVEYLRIPAEPVVPYLLAPSTCKIKGMIKQWLLNFLYLVNRKKLRESNINHSYFMGVMLSGRVTEDGIKKLLGHYQKIAEKHNKDIEIALHPGYIEQGEQMIDGCRADFQKFYFSPWRKKEYDTLINYKF